MNTCPLKQSPSTDCRGYHNNGPSICTLCGARAEAERVRICQRYARLLVLREAFPHLWTTAVCCDAFRFLAIECAEESGYLAGAIDIRIYPNDGKDVWRNYRRVIPAFCPFCGAARPLSARPEFVI